MDYLDGKSKVKAVAKRKEQDWTVPRDRRLRSGEQAFVLPLVIPAALLLLMGAITLMSRTTNSYLVATKQSDAQLAREAAESGMSRVLSTLNPFAKHRTLPYVSFLLASRWVADTGVDLHSGLVGVTAGKAGWRLTNMSQASVRSLLRQCGLSDRGQHPNQLPPNTPLIYRNLLSGSIGSLGTNTGTQLHFLVTDYVPPARPASPSGMAWPSECEDFTTLSGGSAQISVEGRVIRGGKLVARYTLTRMIDVQGWPLVNLPEVWMGAYPGPPAGLRIAGTATSLGMMQSAFYENFSTDVNLSPKPVRQLPLCLNSCPAGRPYPYNALNLNDPTIEYRVPTDQIVPANDMDLPRYPFITTSPPVGIVPLQINESRLNYPYRSAGNTSNSNLYPECRDSQAADPSRPRESRPSEIDCWITSIGVPAQVSDAAYDKTNNRFTITLASRFDVQPGTRIKVDVKTGPLKGSGPWSGTVTSSAGDPQQITFTPDVQPADTVTTYATPGSLVSPDTSLTRPLVLTVNTETRPVNLIITGNVGTPAAADFVVLKNLVRESPAQRYVHAINGVNVRGSWTRLRIFGQMRPPSSSCPATPAQTFYIRPDPLVGPNGEESSLAGSLLWLPQGALVYGTAGLAYPQELLTVWWLCNLDISGLPTSRPTRMTFITPLNGNPEVLEALFPGGFLSGSGEFIPDLRFPVYPSLQRIRSTF